MTLLVSGGVLVCLHDHASLLGCLVGHMTLLVFTGVLVSSHDPASVCWSAGEFI
jgi:hypothetical protein